LRNTKHLVCPISILSIVAQGALGQEQGEENR